LIVYLYIHSFHSQLILTRDEKRKSRNLTLMLKSFKHATSLTRVWHWTIILLSFVFSNGQSFNDRLQTFSLFFYSLFQFTKTDVTGECDKTRMFFLHSCSPAYSFTLFLAYGDNNTALKWTQRWLKLKLFFEKQYDLFYYTKQRRSKRKEYFLIKTLEVLKTFYIWNWIQDINMREFD
jgi:hypothetical protein